MLIEGKFGTDVSNMLKYLGADPRVLYGQNDAYDLSTSLMSFASEIAGTKRKTITAEQQYELAEALMDDPYAAGNTVCAISSYPTDERAKMFGAHLLNEAWMKANSAGQLERVRPIWISLFNQFLDYDKLKQRKPSAVFISNITDDSTNQKLERLRDILELYSNVPRFVMLGSAIDPVTFFATRLRYRVTHPFAIAGKTVAVSLMEGF